MPVYTALITGCSSGLGRALSQELASSSGKNQPGYHVYATARRLNSRLEGLGEMQGPNIKTRELDVTNQNSVASCVRELEQGAGCIDVLVCNAGIAATAPIVEQDLTDVEQIFQTNTFGVLRCVQAVAPGMMKRRSGKIVIVGSITATLASPFNGAYAASKAALHSLCETLQMELSPFGISVIEVWAGSMKTDINAKVADKLESFAKETSAYHPIAAEIKQRAALLEKEGIMPVDNVAAAIAKGLAARKAPRYISTGSDVGMYNVLGFMQTWLCPATISNMLQEKFGLKQLHKHLLSRS